MLQPQFTLPLPLHRELAIIAHPHGIAPSDTFDCTAPWGTREQIDWVIAGGESGHKARPSHPDWYRSLRDQCAAAGVPFLFKQHGEWANSEAAALDLNDCYETSKIGGWVEPDGNVSLGEGAAPASAQASHIFKVGKKAAGRLLDGIEHNGFPS